MDKLKNMKKTTKNNIITYALVIAAFVIDHGHFCHREHSVDVHAQSGLV